MRPYTVALIISLMFVCGFCAPLMMSTGIAQERLTAGQTIGELTVPAGVVVLPDIPYREGASDAWKLDLAMPADRGTAPRPALVFVHGGGWRGGDKRRAAFFGAAVEFAAKGYVCTSVEYRLTGEAPFPACIEDVKCAVRWMRAHAQNYNIDPEKFGAYGNSAGAHLVAILGLCPKSAGLEGDGPWQEYSSMVQAVCCSATPASFIMPMNNRQRNAGNQQQRRSARENWSEDMKRKCRKLSRAREGVGNVILSPTTTTLFGGDLHLPRSIPHSYSFRPCHIPGSPHPADTSGCKPWPRR